MKWLVILCLLVSPAAASTRWTIQTFGGQTVALDATRTATGYRAVLHERQFLWQRQWEAIPCPPPGEQAAGETLLEMDRQDDGSFTVKLYKARLHTSGANGLGQDPVQQCLFEQYTYRGTVVDRATAHTLDPAQIDRYPADHNSFMVLQQVMQPCPVPDSAKRTCITIWPTRPILDMPMLDTDEDGLLDEWEVAGIREGGQTLDLKAMGADPDHKDLFVQMDSSELTKFDPFTLLDIIGAMSQVPVSNPDGRPGITIHIDAGPNSIMNPRRNTTWGTLSKANTSLALTDTDHLGTFAGPDPCPLGRIPDATQFTHLREHNFTDTLRQKAFRYVVLVKYIGTSTNCFTGANWTIPSKWFAIADWKNNEPISSSARVGVFLHELGHSIGLHHGGASDDDNYKPNYQSVMNYAYQISGITTESSPTIGTYKYSSVTPNSSNQLDENHLDEIHGFPNVGEPHTLLNFKCVTTDGRVGELASAIQNRAWDFNCATPPDKTHPAPFDITPTFGASPRVLTTFNDVAHLHLPLDTGSTGAGGAPAGETIKIGDALAEAAGVYKDKRDPTVKATLRKQRGKRTLQIVAKDDVGVATAVVSSGSTQKVLMLAKPRALKKTVTQTMDVELQGDVTVVVTDIVGKTVSATAK